MPERPLPIRRHEPGADGERPLDRRAGSAAERGGSASGGSASQRGRSATRAAGELRQIGQDRLDRRRSGRSSALRGRQIAHGPPPRCAPAPACPRRVPARLCEHGPARAREREDPRRHRPPGHVSEPVRWWSSGSNEPPRPSVSASAASMNVSAKPRIATVAPGGTRRARAALDGEDGRHEWRGVRPAAARPWRTCPGARLRSAPRRSRGSSPAASTCQPSARSRTLSAFARCSRTSTFGGAQRSSVSSPSPR